MLGRKFDSKSQVLLAHIYSVSAIEIVHFEFLGLHTLHTSITTSKRTDENQLESWNPHESHSRLSVESGRLWCSLIFAISHRRSCIFSPFPPSRFLTNLTPNLHSNFPIRGTFPLLFSSFNLTLSSASSSHEEVASLNRKKHD